MGRLQDGRITAGGPSFEVYPRILTFCDGHGFTVTSLVSSFFFFLPNKHIPTIFSSAPKVTSSLALHPPANNQLAQTNSYFIGMFCKSKKVPDLYPPGALLFHTKKPLPLNTAVVKDCQRKCVL